jgi:hypothetical protein
MSYEVVGVQARPEVDPAEATVFSIDSVAAAVQAV